MVFQRWEVVSLLAMHTSFLQKCRFVHSHQSLLVSSSHTVFGRKAAKFSPLRSWLFNPFTKIIICCGVWLILINETFAQKNDLDRHFYANIVQHSLGLQLANGKEDLEIRHGNRKDQQALTKVRTSHTRWNSIWENKQGKIWKRVALSTIINSRHLWP